MGASRLCLLPAIQVAHDALEVALERLFLAFESLDFGFAMLQRCGQFLQAGFELGGFFGQFGVLLGRFGPLTLFIWGPQRILPVQVKEFSIEEQKFDSNLNPIEAKATLSLRVLSYNDLSLTHPGYWIFLLHQIAKEVFATMGSIGNLDNLGELFE